MSFENTKELFKEMVVFMKEQDVCSFEITDVGGLKVSFDPRAYTPKGQAVSQEEIKQKLSEIIQDSEVQRQKEEEAFLFPDL